MTVRRSAGTCEVLGEELPGPVDRLALEVVAEAEVAQHLEERHVPGGLADVLDVAGPDALLAGGGPLEVGVAQAHELALELVHPGRREQDGRVVRDQHVAGTADAALGDEEVEEGFADVVGGHGLAVGPGSGRGKGIRGSTLTPGARVRDPTSKIPESRTVSQTGGRRRQGLEE